LLAAYSTAVFIGQLDQMKGCYLGDHSFPISVLLHGSHPT